MRVLVHSFFLSDIEDPEIFAGEPIIEFKKTDKGQWLCEHGELEMSYDIINDPVIMGYRVNLNVWLSEKDLTYYNLKWK